MTSSSFALALVLVLQGGAPAPVQVHVDGVSGELRRNIRASLSIVQRRGDPEVPESTVRELHARAPAEIREALRPFGHYRPAIRSELEEEGDRWLARYRVEAGPPVRYAAVAVTLSGAGAEDPVLLRAVPAVGVEEGARLRHAVWETAKETLLNRAVGRGYLDARITRSRVEVDTTSLEARAVVDVATGPRYRFGAVRFAETPFRRAMLDRYVTFARGDWFDLDALVELQRGLSSSDYFRTVYVEPLRDRADSLHVPIDVELETRPPIRYTIGAGYGTDTGVRGTAAGRRRWVNARGDRIQGEVRASFRFQTFSGQYIVPLSTGASDRLAASAAVQRDAFGGLESRRLFARAELDHGRGSWREVLSLRLVEEWSREASGTRSSTLLIPEVAWSRTRADDALYPRRGDRVGLAVSGASEAVVSDVGFVQATIQLNVVRGLHPSGRLLARLDVGATAVDELPGLPVSLRLYAGGDRSVRGYAYRSLGPVDADGGVTGGRHRVVGSVEFEQMVVGPIGLAAFTDMGNAFADRDAIAFGALEQGAGFGVRWRSPIGPVRADLAWPVSRGGGPRIHFVVGGTL